MRRALVLLAALPLLAGCGGTAQPRLGHADAAGLIALADRIAAEGKCAQARDIPRLHARAIALLNAKRVPAELQEPLVSGVNDLAAQQPMCLPSVPASSPTITVTLRPRPQPHPHPHPHGPGDHHGHGHDHGHDG